MNILIVMMYLKIIVFLKILKKMKQVVSTSTPKYIIKKFSWHFIAAAILLSSGFCIGAAKEPIHDIIMMVSGKQNEIIVGNKTGDNLIGLGKIYTLANIPDGYRLMNSFIDIESANSCYSNGKNTFTFAQIKESAYKSAYVNSEINNEYITDESGQEYFLLSEDESVSVIWHKDGYVFMIYGNIDKNTAVNLCDVTNLK